MGDRYDRQRLASYADGICYFAFEPYVGRDYESSEFDYEAVVPSAAAWRGGERTVNCMLYHIGHDQLSGSARNSRR